jgi:PAS domain S-box-containing protein
MNIRQQLDETERCSNDFACLWSEDGKPYGFCEIKNADGENVLFLKGKMSLHCSYHLRFGYSDICRCPTLYKLYRLSYEKDINRPVGVWVSDANDVIVKTNRQMEKIAGIPADQILGKCVRTDFPDDTIRHFLLQFDRAKETGKSCRYENVPVATPAGRQGCQSGWLIPKVIRGKVARMVCVFEEIEEQWIEGQDGPQDR